MTLDLTKPIRHKVDKTEYRFLYKLQGNVYSNIVVIHQNLNGSEGASIYPENTLENIPESRWLNVYADCNLSSTWKSSRLAAEIAMSPAHISKCVGIIEDKQDGSPWIVHQLS